MKIVKWVAIVLLVLIALLATAIATVVGTESGRLWLVDKGLGFAEQAGLEVDLDRLRTPQLGHWQVARLRIGGDEPLLEIDQLELRWQPRELLQKRLHILNLSARRVQFYQQESMAEPDTADEPGQFPQLPSSPVAIELDRLQVDELTLHGLSLPASQSLPSYQVSGSASAFTATAPLALNLEVQSLRDADNVLRIQTQLIDSEAIRIQGEFYESPQGLVGTLAQLPDQQEIDLQFELAVRQQHDHIELAIARLQLPFLQHRFAAKGTLQYRPRQQSLRISQLLLRSGEQRHVLEGSIDPEDLWLDAKFQQFPLDVASPWLADLESGTFSGRLQLDWAYGSGQQLPNVSTDSDIEVVFREQRIAAQLEGELKGQMVNIAPSRIELQQASLDVAGQVDLEGTETDLDAQLNNFSSDLLQPWNVALPPTLQVSSEIIKLHMSGAIKDPQLTVETKVAGRYQQQPFLLDLAGKGSMQQVQIQRLELVAEASKVNAAGVLDWTGNGTDLTVNLDNIKHTLLELAPQAVREQYPEELTFTANGRVQLQGPLKAPRLNTDASISGEYAFPEQVLPYRITAVAAGQVGGPTELDIDIEQLTLTLAGEPTVDINGHYQQQSMDLRVQLNRMPTKVLAALGVDTRGGEALADLTLQGDINNPQLQGFVELRSAGTQSTEPQAAPPYALRAQLSSTDQQLHTQIKFNYDGENVGDLRIQFPLADYLQAQGPWQDMPLAIQAQGNMDLNVSTLFLEPNAHQLQGQLRTDITVQGTAAQPDLRGQIILNDGYYYNAAQNISASNIEVVLQGAGETITVEKARARGADNGFLELDGRIHWHEQRRNLSDAIELNLQAKRFVVMQTQEIYAELRGEASLTGSFEELWLKGNFDISPLRASIDAAIKTPIPTIEVTEVGDDEEQQQDAASPMPRINLDLVIAAGQQAYLSGRGLATELGGRITVTGTAEEPQFVGRFTTLRGRLDIFGRRFVLGDGEIRFSNNAASLRIQAEYTGDDITVEALIAGTADNPKLTLTSEPALPQDELMARLIFGKSVQNLNTAEALRLAGAINTLRSGGGGFDPIDTARQKLGVDTLTIENEETETGSGLTMGVGKYVNEKVYIELKSSRNTAQPWQGNVEVELTPRVNLEGGTSEDGGANARLMWKKDY